MYHFNEIAILNISVLPTQLMTADTFYHLKMLLVPSYGN